MTDLRPYPEYKDSGVVWLGAIPAHWELVPNRALFKLKKNPVGSHSSAYNLLSLTLRGVILRNLENIQGKFPASFDTYQVVEAGDFIFCFFDVDETPRTVGLSEHHGMITGAYTVMETRNPANPRYFYYYYLSLDERKVLKPIYRGLRKTIPTDSFLVSKSPVPPPDEQAAIVTFLDAAETRIRRYIRAKQKLIKLLNEQKQTIIQQAVTRGLDPDVPMKDSGVEWLREIPAHWEVSALRHRFSVQLGKMLDAKKFTNAYAVHYLRNKDVQWGKVNVGSLPVMDIHPSEYERYTLKTGDLLVCEGGDVGRAAFWNGQIDVCGYQKALHRVRVLDRNRDMPQFLYYLMFTIAKLGVFIADGSENTIAHLTNEKLRAYRFQFPAYEEQKQIVEYLENYLPQLEDNIEQIKVKIDLIHEYRTRLIADVVTGKVDVRGVAFEMPEAFDESDLLDVDEDELFDEDVFDGELEEGDA